MVNDVPHNFIIRGRPISLNALSPQLDDLFEELHAAHFGGPPIALDDLATAAGAYFSVHLNDWASHDAYFNNFTIIWQELLKNEKYRVAEELWKSAIATARTWEERGTERIHKGTPYYFWAMTVLLQGDIDRGYLLIHQAVEEDVRTHQQERPNTPGYALVSLNHQRVDQAFREWVIEQAEFLNAVLQNYTMTHGRTLTFNELKRRFIDLPPDTDTVFLLTYTMARIRKLTELPPYAIANGFAGQLELNLMFDIALIIEIAIKHKNSMGRGSFITQAEYLLATAREPLSNQQLREINDAFRNAFDATLDAARNATFTLADGTILTRLQADIALTYGIRNRGGHNAQASPTLWQHFPEILDILFRSLCASIDYLY